MQCFVCSKSASLNCSHCYKIQYCSKTCQVAHWKCHKIECFPLRIESSEKLGRYLIATKHIKQWDLILKEKPIVSGPTAETLGDIICLGCLVILEKPYHKCSSCSWPVCSSDCEKLKTHADFECKIFAKESLKPLPAIGSVYNHIRVLRGLMLKDSNATKWNEILSLQANSNSDSALSTLLPVSLLGLLRHGCVEFIRNTCRLTQFTTKEIEHVQGAISTNGFGGESYKNEIKNSGSYLYNVASMAAHSCFPNTYRLIDKNSVCQIRACIDIPAGSPVTTFYTDIWVPTQQRQAKLSMSYSFRCTCERCIDPTELGTFMSAIKCNTIIKGSCSGYFLPTEPLNEDTDWRCTECKQMTQNNKINDFNTQFDEIVEEVPEDVSIVNIQSLFKIAKLYGPQVHPNHFILLNMEYDLIERLHNLLSLVGTRSSGISAPQTTSFFTRLLTYCNHQLEICDKIRPGFTLYRGKVLYMQQRGMLLKLLHCMPRPNKPIMKRQIQEIEDIRAKALKILSVEPGEDNQAIVQSLKNESEVRCVKLALGI